MRLLWALILALGSVYAWPIGGGGGSQIETLVKCLQDGRPPVDCKTETTP